jgi:acetyl-CoA carboxylase/biotin carboxylase 1
MEAKGCAKPVVWKESRRYFYWAMRGRLARSNAVAQLAAAYPSKPREYHEDALYQLYGINEQSDHRTMARKLENVDLSPFIPLLKSENIVHQFLGDRKSLVDGLVRLVDHLSEDEKATILTALRSTNDSSGLSYSRTRFGYFINNCAVL